MPLNQWSDQLQRMRTILRDEGLPVLLGKLAIVARRGLYHNLGWQGPYRPRYVAPQDAKGPEDWLFTLASPRTDWWPVVGSPLVIRGVAHSLSGVARIAIAIDGRAIGNAAHGVQGRGADVPPEIVSRGDILDEGRFHLTVDAGGLRSGWHTLALCFTDGAGRVGTCHAKILYVPGLCCEDPYAEWIRRCEPALTAERRTRAHLATDAVKFSVVMPVYNTESRLLRAAIDSVRAQTYKNWELCVADDASTRQETRQVLEAYARADPRVRVVRAGENGGISAASNLALALATGDYIAFLDHDDCLAANALLEMAVAIAGNANAAVIYSDEDKIDLAGFRYEPFFKPDWSPELFLSMNYLNHLTCVRTDLVRAAGGFRSELDGAQDYDLLLRGMELVEQQGLSVIHVPMILYHWRAAAGSTADTSRAKPWAQQAARRALADALQRRGIAGAVEEAAAAGRWRVRYAPASDPLVSVLVPSGGRLALLRNCMEGLHQKTQYKRVEVVLLDNSKDGKVREYFEHSIAHRFPRCRYIDFVGAPFNYSAINNRGAKVASGELLLFLNDDVFPLNIDWMESLIEHATRPAVGAVGAKLLYEDHRLQHAGVVMGLKGCTGHAFKLIKDEEAQPVYFDLPNVVRNCSAVTAACLMLRRAAFEEVGGFDEEHLPIAFQDVDLCLKLLHGGYRNVYTPFAKLLHFESVSKGEKEMEPTNREMAYMRSQWARIIGNDPYYSPHLTRDGEDYTIRLRYE